jgi:heptosyltransferase-2
MIIKTDCAHFNGYKPCRPHKEKGVHCNGCPDYRANGPLILVIKLRAAGEVIRNTPLLRKIQAEHPGAKIFWLTQYPELLPREPIHKILPWGFESSLILEDIEFDVLYSLDKDLEACALANRVRAKKKKGFTQKNGVILPFDEDSRRKWTTGAFDDLMKANRRHYIEEIFEICGFEFSNESYWLPNFEAPSVDLDRKRKIIALNTGAGDMWKPRLYSEKRWQELAKLLIAQGHEVFLTGGPSEHERNQRIAQASSAKYFGTFPFLKFIGLLSLADVIVTSVSFAFHVGIGLGKPIVLLNNTFNPFEFYMYGKGKVLQPELDCLMCYKNDFDSQCVTRDCMDLISSERVAKEVISHLT